MITEQLQADKDRATSTIPNSALCDNKATYPANLWPIQRSFSDERGAGLQYLAKKLHFNCTMAFITPLAEHCEICSDPCILGGVGKEVGN